MSSKIAVIAGINRYYNLVGSDLLGCINDAAAIKANAESSGFDVYYMTNPADNVFAAALKSAIANCYPGDKLLVSESGHGSYIPDASGDESVDHRDEITCFSNFSASGGYITDDQFRVMFDKLRPGVICHFIKDTCFSGTSTRASRLQTHNIPVLGNRYVPFPGKAKKSVKTSTAKAIVVPTLKESLLAACGEGQTSAEVLIGGVPRGLFTYYVLKGLSSNPTYNIDQLMNWVKPKVAAVVFGQTPQLECTSANASSKLFT